jgi:hypothetical protein
VSAPPSQAFYLLNEPCSGINVAATLAILAAQYWLSAHTHQLRFNRTLMNLRGAAMGVEFKGLGVNVALGMLLVWLDRTSFNFAR